MTTSHDSRFAGSLVLTTALSLGPDWAKRRIWRPYGASGPDAWATSKSGCVRNPIRTGRSDFAATYTTQDYPIVLLDRVAIANSHVFCCSLRLAIRRARRSRAKS